MASNNAHRLSTHKTVKTFGPNRAEDGNLGSVELYRRQFFWRKLTQLAALKANQQAWEEEKEERCLGCCTP